MHAASCHTAPASLGARSLLIAGPGTLLLVEEEQLRVGGQRPQVGGDDGLGLVGNGARVDHRLEAEHARERGLAVGVGRRVQAVQALVDGGDGGLELGQQVAEVVRGLQASKESMSARKAGAGQGTVQ